MENKSTPSLASQELKTAHAASRMHVPYYVPLLQLLHRAPSTPQDRPSPGADRSAPTSPPESVSSS